MAVRALGPVQLVTSFKHQNSSADGIGHLTAVHQDYGAPSDRSNTLNTSGYSRGSTLQPSQTPASARTSDRATRARARPCRALNCGLNTYSEHSVSQKLSGIGIPENPIPAAIGPWCCSDAASAPNKATCTNSSEQPRALCYSPVAISGLRAVQRVLQSFLVTCGTHGS